MRTVTFADETLVGTINNSVIPVWHNQSPDEAQEEQNAAAQPAPCDVPAYPWGGGGGNIRTYFCTPKGQVFHYLEGYWPPEQFNSELESAMKLFAEVKNIDFGPAWIGIQTSALLKRESDAERQRQALQTENQAEFQKAMAESAVRRQHAALGLKMKSYGDGRKLAGRDISAVLVEIIRRNIHRGVIT